jgi:hypothetical protein
MSVTEADFIRRVLEELNVLGTGQVVDSDDAAKVKARLSTTFADLSARGVVTVTDIAQADDALINPLVAAVAARCARAFAIAGSELAEIVALAEAAERAIRAMGNALDGRIAGGAEYF